MLTVIVMSAIAHPIVAGCWPVRGQAEPDCFRMLRAGDFGAVCADDNAPTAEV